MSGIPEFRVILKRVMEMQDLLFSHRTEPAAFPFPLVTQWLGILHAGEYIFEYFLLHRSAAFFRAVLSEGFIHFCIRDMCSCIGDEELPVERPDPVKFLFVLEQRHHYLSEA